jgi:hypothetical protein
MKELLIDKIMARPEPGQVRPHDGRPTDAQRWERDATDSQTVPTCTVVVPRRNGLSTDRPLTDSHRPRDGHRC